MIPPASDSAYTVKRVASLNGIFRWRKPLLTHLDIELTERCNNACMHCYINLPESDSTAKARELTTKQLKDILSQAADLGAFSVRFTGGEPLLREDFTEIYLFARHLGLRVYLFTNGRLITPELAQIFKNTPLLAKVEITVYGMHPESYDAVACTSGAYDEAFRGIKNLLDYEVPFVVKSVILPPNRSERSEFAKWAAALPAMNVSAASVLFLDYRARRDSKAKNKLINSLRLRPEEALQLLTEDEPAYRKDMAAFAAWSLRPQGDRLFTCGAGGSGCVDAYGNYQLCMQLRPPDFVYDLKQGSLKQALTEVFPVFLDARATNPAYLERCAMCFLRGLCEQCPAKSWMESGTLDTPVEYLCSAAHVQARYLGLLKEGENAWEINDWKEKISSFVNEQSHSSSKQTSTNKTSHELDHCA